jgi:hypothetical protein
MDVPLASPLPLRKSADGVDVGQGLCPDPRPVFPSPSMGEGVGGGEDCCDSPHLNPPIAEGREMWLKLSPPGEGEGDVTPWAICPQSRSVVYEGRQPGSGERGR